jgi:hypothetical protein
MPPAVKGLKDIAFREGDGVITIEFGESAWAWDSVARMFRRLREWLIETQDTDTADRIVPEYSIQDIQQASTPAQEAELYAEKEENQMKESGKETPPQTFSEADVERIRGEARAEGRKEAEAQFAQTQRQAKAQAVKDDIAAFCEGLARDGKLLPAWEKLGLRQFLESLDHETVIEFGEGDAGKKSRLEFMKAFLAEIPKVVSFTEVATRDKSTVGAGSAGEKLAEITRKKMDANPKLPYAAAFAEAQTENADLAREYQAEIGGE